MELLSLFDFHEVIAERTQAFEKSKDNYFASNLKEFLNEEEMKALLIRDINTCGLGGDLDKFTPEDHFARLVYASHLGDKADNDINSGGSFGLGKTVYAKSSKINTVLFHSTFKANERSSNVSRRLMVAGVYPQYEFKNKEYTGFAYFGKEDQSNDNTTKPFENDEAGRMWSKVISYLLLRPRETNDATARMSLF